jgi:tetratricopeptide (TPR) repeat protein
MKFISSAGFVLFGLMFMVGDSYAEEGIQPVSPSISVTNNALSVLLNKANILIKSGKQAEAFDLLEPEEGEYSGEVGYDYLLGIAALDSGKPDRATIAFERVLIVNPKFAGARLDLARAYVTMGSDDLAKKEFETVLTQSPPEQVMEVVHKYLDSIEERRKAKLQQITSYLESSIGFDNNITAATPDFTSGVQGAFGIPNVLPTGSSQQYQGMYESVSGGADITRKVNEEKGVSLFAGADIKKRFYNILGSMNNANLDLRTGLSVAKGDDTYRLTTTYGKYLQTGFVADSNNDRNTAGVSTEWKHSFGERNQMTWSLQYSQPRFLMMPTQDTNQLSLSASWLHIFEGEMTPLIFTNLSRSVDRALRELASGSDMSRTGTSLMMHSQITPMPNTDLFLSGGLSVRHDDSPNARSQLTTDFYAQDVTQNMSIGVITRPWTKWTIKGTLALTNNLSNLELYKYRRLDSFVSLRRDF